MLRSLLSVPLLLVVASIPTAAQGEAERLREPLAEEVIAPSVPVFELRDYLLKRIAAPPAPHSAAEWSAEASRIRARALATLFHGWPKEWVESAPKFEELGVLSGNGYRIRKLRFEIVPGFYSTALLYEPENLRGKVPAILNVNGHERVVGKAAEYKQKRCITFARNGALALSLEWLACGELRRDENGHFYSPLLDLAGVHGTGLFYLAMRRGLDYLYEHPNTDRARIGMTGLSGGGWQTITLSSLDERIRAAVPVAGFSSLATRVEVNRFGDVGDPEQAATDEFEGIDFTHLTAMMAPRPVLLAYNAEDDCCFRGPAVRNLVFDAIRPVYALYGKETSLDWHENSDPGTHNYQLDNRLAAYRFFSRVFNMPPIESEGSIGPEVRSYDELVVGLPKDNLSILDLARKFAGDVRRAPQAPAGTDAERIRLRQIVRYRPAAIARAWTVGITKNKGIETRAHLFAMQGGLSATGVWLKAINASPGAPVTIVLDDRGRAAAAEPVWDRITRGDQVLALDLAFFGPSWSRDKEAWEYEQILYGTGDRPLGIEAAQLVAIARWMAQRAGVREVRLETSGIRTQIVGLVAAALEPGLFSHIDVRNGMRSIEYVFRKPVEYADGPDLFCLDLYKETDIERLAALAAPAAVRTLSHVE